TIPEIMSAERRVLHRAYGAESVLTPGAASMQGAVDKENEILAQQENAVLARQFTNKANAKINYETNGVEIWEDTGQKVEAFVAGVGSGGTVTGAGRYLKEKNADLHLVAVEPADSPILTEGKAGPHKIQGLGANFIPEVLDRE